MHDYFAKAIDYKGGEFGVGILTKEEPVREALQLFRELLDEMEALI